MDKRRSMHRKKKFFIYRMAACVIILGFVIVGNKYINKKNHQQTKLESVLPGTQQMEDEISTIRVLIKTDGFAQIAHQAVEVQATSGIIITSGGKQKESEGTKSITITPDDDMFQNGPIRIKTKSENEKITIVSLQRGCGNPSYRGEMDLFPTAEGIVIINELLLEEYLYAVVPSEMPSSYQLEALKAQAVCARSYAYNQSTDYSYPEYQAHVDDSVSFQVYGNSKEQDSTIRAVNETTGQKIWYKNQVATAYYYSTSCGKSASIEAWGGTLNETNEYLQSREICDENKEHYEKGIPWYRWTATVPAQIMSDLIETNTQTEIGSLLNIAITKEGAGGIVQEITIVGTTGKVVVSTENKIRRTLGGAGYQIVKQDGSTVSSTELLPSAFFNIGKKDGNYIICGGGYGHGIGMSQNGANEMAKAGKDYQEILKAFYTGVEVR